MSILSFSSVQSQGVASQCISSITWHPIFSKIARDAAFALLTVASAPVPCSPIALKMVLATNDPRPRFRNEGSVYNVPIVPV